MNESGRRIQEPPDSFWGSLRFLGPGLILSAAIVGSGELIATTALGARTGFTLLWIILFGCLVKVLVQLEYGRYCICHGKASFEAWNLTGGPRLLGLHWTVIIGFFFMLSMFVGLAGVLGGAAQVATYAIPGVSVGAWTVILAVSLAVIVFHGRYRIVEMIATALNFIFLMTIGYCVFALQGTGYAFGWRDLLSGLTFHLPAEAVPLALGAFGIIGVGAVEIFTYPYWCLEKGYAAWTGENDGSHDWNRRARGWTRVMKLDALLAMVIYTAATYAFYILGATVLNRQETLADGNELVLQLSRIFTEVLGEGAVVIFMIGAFTVLYSTVFSNGAAYPRLWTDLFAVCGIVDRNSRKQWGRSVAIMSWVIPALWAAVYLKVQQPLYLVIFMGIANSLFLLVVAYQGLVFRYRRTVPALRPSRWYDLILWLSVLSILLMAARTLQSTLS